MAIAIGVDLGGSNLRIAAIRVADGALVAHHREPVGEPRDPDTIVRRLVAVIERMRAEAKLEAEAVVPVGIGLAAMLRDTAGTVANSPHLRWRDVPFGRLLAAALGGRARLGVYNDVNAIAYGEQVHGAARGVADVLLVFVGTGIGAGVIAGGRLVEGASSCAGELGHAKVVWGADAAPCACGGRGCVEAYIGGSYVQARARRELAAGARSIATRDTAIDAITPGDVDRAAAAGDAWALGLWAELAPLLGVTLANAIAVLNPARLVLGGGMLGRTQVLRAQVIAALHALAPAASLEPLTVADAILGDDAGLVGAALLADAGVSIIC
ncbi:MAG: ROK family protein [Deltaproteobacteria bacterium]|nr:ROK family protein [Deltaproteobacteria bacterium]